MSAWEDLAARGLAGLATACTRGAEGLQDGARTARFLRGRLEFVARPDDVFISSYPRSGTTWLQQILVVLQHGGDPGGAHISQHAPWFERQLSLGQRRAADFEALRSPRIFKSHLPYAWLPAGARYVYAIRDGRDVAVSYYHLYRSHLGFTGSFDAFYERFLRGQLQYGSYFKHVAGWQRVADRPEVCIVHYDALRADLVGVMTRLSRFCGGHHSAAQLRSLSTLCSFEYMKAHQERFDHATEARGLDTDGAGGQFIRRGGSGGYRDYFDAAALRRFERASAAPQRRPDREWDLPAFLH